MLVWMAALDDQEFRVLLAQVDVGAIEVDQVQTENEEREEIPAQRE